MFNSKYILLFVTLSRFRKDLKKLFGCSAELSTFFLKRFITQAVYTGCIKINYIWLNQLSNTTNLWWIDVYYLVINYMFRRLWPSSGR